MRRVSMEESYTRQEVCSLLEVSKVTVYHYAKQGKIRKIFDPHYNAKEARYARKEVDELYLKKQSQPEGISVSEACKKLGVSKAKVYSLIKEGVLQADTIPFGDEHKRFIIKKESIEKTQKYLSDQVQKRAAKWEFYDQILNVALFQLFISPSDRFFRLLKNEEQQWGFYTDEQTWLNYKEAIKIMGLKPVYNIHQETLRKSQFYVDFELPKSDADSLKILDIFYSVAGVENLRLRDECSVIRLSIKEGSYPAGVINDSLLNLMKPITYGTINYEKGQLYIESNYKRHYFELPNVFIEQFNQIAEEKNVTQHELLEQLIGNFLTTHERTF